MRYLKLFLLYGIPFGIMMGIRYCIQYDALKGFIMGAIAGILFGVIMAFITLKLQKRYKRLKETTSTAIKDEIIFDSYANRIAGFFPIEGWLFLTENSLFFAKKSKKDQQLLITEFKLDSIEEVNKCKYRLNPNALSIIAEGKQERFIFANIEKDRIVKAEDWADLLNGRINRVEVQMFFSSKKISN